MDNNVQLEPVGFKYTGPWVNCPDCESKNAYVRILSEGSSNYFHCPECDFQRTI